MTMLLFFDIDGTLIDHTHRLPASVPPALEAAHRSGHLLVVNTGRTLCNMDHRLDGLPIDGLIMGCGTRVIWHGETLTSMEYGLSDSLRLLEIFRNLNLPTVYECDTAMYFDPLRLQDPILSGLMDWSKNRGIFRTIADTDPEFRAVKMLCFAESSVIGELVSRTAAAGLPYTAIDRENNCWEIIPSGITKATGMDFLCNYLGIPASDCFAFGDSRNDLAMLTHVPNSIAMGNAPDDVKELCTYVTARPEEDGIEKALRHFRLI